MIPLTYIASVILLGRITNFLLEDKEGLNKTLNTAGEKEGNGVAKMANVWYVMVQASSSDQKS